MKNKILLSADLLLLIVGFFYFRPDPAREKQFSGAENKAAQDAAVANALARQNLTTVALIASNFARVTPPSGGGRETVAGLASAPAGPPAPLEFTDLPPAIVLQNMSRVIHKYSVLFGGNPVGNNVEITRQLTGENPKHLNLLGTDAGPRVNGDGELVDPWGTPYFFHQISGTDMEIHSAGPDRILWTADDLVAR